MRQVNLAEHPELMRIMLGTMTQLHLSQNFEHALLALRLSYSEVFQLQIHILLNGKFVDKVEVLEHEADATLAIGGTLTLLHYASRIINLFDGQVVDAMNDQL